MITDFCRITGRHRVADLCPHRPRHPAARRGQPHRPGVHAVTDSSGTRCLTAMPRPATRCAGWPVYVLAPARKAVTGRIGLRPTAGGFGTPPSATTSSCGCEGPSLRPAAGRRHSTPSTITLVGGGSRLRRRHALRRSRGRPRSPRRSATPTRPLSRRSCRRGRLGAWFAFSGVGARRLPGGARHRRPDLLRGPAVARALRPGLQHRGRQLRLLARRRLPRRALRLRRPLEHRGPARRRLLERPLRRGAALQGAAWPPPTSISAALDFLRRGADLSLQGQGDVDHWRGA